MFSTLMEVFDSSIIFHKTYIVFTYYMYLIPVFFGISLGIRLLEESVKNIGEEANYSKAFQEAFITSILVFSYAAVACVVCQLILAINNYAGSQGSFSMIFGEYNEIIDGMKEAAQKENEALYDKILNKIGFPLELAAGACFALTFALLMFVHLFLRFAYAVLFCFLFTWGGIAIATSPSQVLSLKGGFVATLKGLIIWPIVESIFYVLAYLLISQAGDNLVEFTTNATKAGDVSFAYFIFSFTNIFLLAVIIAAAAVSFYLSQNQSAMAGVTAPFIAAGLGAGALFSKAIQKGGSPSMKMAGNKVKSSLKSVGGGIMGAAGKKMGSAPGVGNIISQASNLLNKDFLGGSSQSAAKDRGTVGNIIPVEPKKKD